MAWETIRKGPEDKATAVLTDYDQACAAFTWSAARADLDGLPNGGLNIAYEAVDRHFAHGGGDRIALRWLAKDGTCREFRYRDLAEQSNRIANLLRSLGVGKGERVFSLLGRQPDLYVAAIGTLKCGCVFSPLFSAFGPEPIRTRLSLGDGRVLVTSEALYRPKSCPASGMCCSSMAEPGRTAVSWTCSAHFPKRHRPSLVRKRHRTTWRFSTSPAAPPAVRRGPCMCMRPSSPIMQRPGLPSTCGRVTYSGAPPIPAG